MIDERQMMVPQGGHWNTRLVVRGNVNAVFALGCAFFCFFLQNVEIGVRSLLVGVPARWHSWTFWKRSSQKKCQEDSDLWRPELSWQNFCFYSSRKFVNNRLADVRFADRNVVLLRVLSKTILSKFLSKGIIELYIIPSLLADCVHPVETLTILLPFVATRQQLLNICGMTSWSLSQTPRFWASALSTGRTLDTDPFCHNVGSNGKVWGICLSSALTRKPTLPPPPTSTKRGFTRTELSMVWNRENWGSFSLKMTSNRRSDIW